MDLLALFQDLFTDYTLRTVSMGAAVLGIVSGVLGSFAVLRRQSLLGDAMSHAALPGIVLVFLLLGTKAPLQLMIGAILAGWLGVLLVVFITQQTRIKQDSSLGIVLAVFFAFGVGLMSWIQRHQGSAAQSGLDKFLFGRAAALVERDVVTMALLGGVTLIAIVLFWKEFKLISFNPEYAASLGLPVRGLGIFLTTLIVVAIVIGLQTVGVVLMSAMVIAPAVAARQWTDRLGWMVILAGFFGAMAGISGAMISSLGSGLSTGPVIVLTISAIVVISLLVAPNRGLLARWLRKRRNRGRIRRVQVLEALYMMGLHHEDPTHPHSLEMLQAALPGYGVAPTLNQLKSEGLVRFDPDRGWGLTPEGLDNVRSNLRHIHAEGGVDPDRIPELNVRRMNA